MDSFSHLKSNINPPPKRRLVWSFCNTGENLQCVIWNRQWVNVLHMHMQARVLEVHLSMQTVHIQKQSGHRMRRWRRWMDVWRNWNDALILKRANRMEPCLLICTKESIDIMDDVNMWHEQSQWEKLYSSAGAKQNTDAIHCIIYTVISLLWQVKVRKKHSWTAPLRFLNRLSNAILLLL